MHVCRQPSSRNLRRQCRLNLSRSSHWIPVGERPKFSDHSVVEAVVLVVYTDYTLSSTHPPTDAHLPLAVQSTKVAGTTMQSLLTGPGTGLAAVSRSQQRILPSSRLPSAEKEYYTAT